MKYFELDSDEKAVLKDYESGKVKPLPDTKKSKKQYEAYAKNALAKTKNVNIRISENDLLKIKSMAVKKGIPYQTVLSSLIHQYSTGQLRDG